MSGEGTGMCGECQVASGEGATAPVAAPSGGVGAARKGKNKGNKKQRGGGGKTGGERGWLMDD